MASDSDVGRRKELDREIGSYISSLRKKEKSSLLSFLKGLKGKGKKGRVELHPEVEAYGPAPAEPKKEEKEEKEGEELEEEFEEGAKKKTFWQWLKGIFAAEEEVDIPEEEYVEEIIEEEAEDEEAPEEIEEEYVEEVQKKGFFARLFGSIFPKTREEEEFEEVSDELAEDIQDMKTIAEIATKAMKMLPPDKMKEFKETEDFKTFKEILKKRELIK